MGNAFLDFSFLYAFKVYFCVDGNSVNDNHRLKHWQIAIYIYSIL